jgi:hypothetical protein
MIYIPLSSFQYSYFTAPVSRSRSRRGAPARKHHNFPPSGFTRQLLRRNVDLFPYSARIPAVLMPPSGRIGRRDIFSAFVTLPPGLRSIYPLCGSFVIETSPIVPAASLRACFSSPDYCFFVGSCWTRIGISTPSNTLPLHPICASLGGTHPRRILTGRADPSFLFVISLN